MSSGTTILFLSHSANLYGAERCLLELLTGLRDRGYRPHVLIPSTGPLTDVLKHERISFEVHPLPGWLVRQRRLLPAIYRLSANVCMALWLRRHLGKLDPSLIYTNTTYSPLGGLLSRLLGIPHIWHIHEMVEEGLGFQFDLGKKFSMKFLGSFSSRIVCNSRAVRSLLEPYVSDKRLVVVYNGPLHDLAPAQPRHAPRLGSIRPARLAMVASMHPGKGHEDAIRALELLAKRSWSFQLRLIGSGPDNYIAQLKALADRVGVADNVQWSGFMQDLTEVYRESDVVLVCTRFEAFGRVAVEAMAAGCPVVASNAGGLREVIDDGTSGLLYAPGDSRQLAHQVLRLLEEPGLYESISHQAILAAYQRFTRSRYVTEIEAVIRAALEESAGQSVGSTKKGAPGGRS